KGPGATERAHEDFTRERRGVEEKLRRGEREARGPDPRVAEPRADAAREEREHHEPREREPPDFVKENMDVGGVIFATQEARLVAQGLEVPRERAHLAFELAFEALGEDVVGARFGGEDEPVTTERDAQRKHHVVQDEVFFERMKELALDGVER